MTDKTIHVNGAATKTTRKTIDHTAAAKLAMGDDYSDTDLYSVICYDPSTGCGQSLEPDTARVDLKDGMQLTVSKRRW